MGSRASTSKRRARKVVCPKHGQPTGKTSLEFRCGCPTEYGQRVADRQKQQ